MNIGNLLVLLISINNSYIICVAFSMTIYIIIKYIDITLILVYFLFINIIFVCYKNFFTSKYKFNLNYHIHIIKSYTLLLYFILIT